MSSKAGVHTRQPQYGVLWNPRYGKPVGLWNFRLAGVRNLVDGRHGVATSMVANSQEVGTHGIGYQNDAAGGHLLLPDYSSVVAATGEATAILVYQSASTYLSAAGGNTPWSLGTGTYPDEFPYYVGATATSGPVYMDAFTGTTRWIAGTTCDLSVAPIGSLAVLAIQAKSGAMRLSLNGVTLATSASAYTIALPAAPKILGDPRFANEAFTGRRSHAFMLDSRRWTDAQIAEIAENPWRLFAPMPRKSFASLSAATSATPTVADSAAGADSLAVAAAAALADAAAGADSPALAAALGLADAAAGADALTVAVSLAASDSATGTDSATSDSNTPITLADAATGSDALSVAVALALADAAAGVDAVSVPQGATVGGISPLPYASPYSAGGGALSHAQPAEPKRLRRLRVPTAKAPAAAPVPAPAVPQIVVRHLALADAARGASRVAIEGWGLDVRPVFPLPRPAVLIRTRPSTRR